MAHQCEKVAISWKWGLRSGELRQDVREGQYTRKRVARVGVVLLRRETSQRWSHEKPNDRKEACRENAVEKAREADPLCSADEPRVGLAHPWGKNEEGRP